MAPIGYHVSVFALRRYFHGGKKKSPDSGQIGAFAVAELRQHQN